MSLYLAKENMNKWTWQKCCENAIQHLNIAGMKHASNPWTVMEWGHKFRPKYLCKITLPTHSLPPFLQHNPEICTTVKQYAKEHLAELSVEFMFDCIHKTILPQIVTETVGKDAGTMTQEQYNRELKNILHTYQLSSVSLVTIYRWMRHLGFKYEPRKKGTTSMAMRNQQQ